LQNIKTQNKSKEHPLATKEDHELLISGKSEDRFRKSVYQDPETNKKYFILRYPSKENES
jgi:hypothetical protein